MTDFWRRVGFAWSAFGGFLLGLVILFEATLATGPLAKLLALTFIISGVLAFYLPDTGDSDD